MRGGGWGGGEHESIKKYVMCVGGVYKIVIPCSGNAEQCVAVYILS